MVVAQTKRLCRRPSSIAIPDLNDFAFSKVISTTIRTKLRHLVREILKFMSLKQFFKSIRQRVTRPIMSQVE